jgi:hypothetical protein
VAISRIRLRSYGYQTPKRGVMIGDPTPERAVKAADVTTEEETFEDGRPTGLRRRRVLSELEMMRNKLVLTADQFAAAQRFQRSGAFAQAAEGKLISNYAARLSTPLLSPS